MLTKITIRNFKLFENVEIELGNPVVFVGPNNSGKTTALQALTLWELGIKRWSEKYADKPVPAKRTGVAINRRDLYAVPQASTLQLWRALKVRRGNQGGQPQQPIVRIEIIVEGVSKTIPWSCGLEFDFANSEVFYCRPLRNETPMSHHVEVPQEARDLSFGYLPPMSGLASNEVRLEQGALDVRVGEGRTAEVLRNLCYQVYTDNPTAWESVVQRIEDSFGAKLLDPEYIAERGEISMSYRDNGFELDMSASGRGLQQTLLLLVFMYAKSGSVVLLDEPDAHLELLRQQQVYQTITEVAYLTNSQVIIASHSEIILDQAYANDLVIAFVGKPHSIDKGKSQVRKALTKINFQDFYQAKITGWLLYLEGYTDLAMLQAFAKRIEHHEAIEALKRPFVKQVGNEVKRVGDHFFGVQEALPELRGIALFDRMKLDRDNHSKLHFMTWKKREIENYVCTFRTLENFATEGPLVQELRDVPLFQQPVINEHRDAMQSVINEVSHSFEVLGKGTPWDSDVKASDEVLIPIFEQFFKYIKLPNLMAKKSFHELVEYIPDEEIDSEIRDKLDAIVAVARTVTRPN
ncbi:MAG: AAA family ATPase [Gammaproteobacteria bacterium]|nr:AAA family ATPase [Gammaproteobacteria bacterium]MYI76395.1 AAA family ATPase [Gammaproteobacteria bacterium]